jgi:hypothetical protein
MYYIGKTEDDQDIYGMDFDIEVRTNEKGEPDVKQTADGKRTISMIGSTPSVDRDGDTINQSGWDLKAFRQNPVVQWAHNHSIPAIGRANKFTKTKDALDFKEIEFPKEGIHPFADMIFELVTSKFIKMGSVGFIPTKFEQREQEEGEAFSWAPTKFLKQELLEFSIVNVGSNRDALSYLQGKGYKADDVNKLFESVMTQDKRVIPYKKYPLDDEEAAWNGPKEKAAAEVDDLKKMSTWVDSEKDDVKGGYKLHHHRADGYNTVWRGVAAAMAALLGARGGVDIPDGDRKGVFNHLARHYKEFDKDVPEFKDWIEEEFASQFGLAEDCVECETTIGVVVGDKFTFEGKTPLCGECFEKIKEEGDGAPHTALAFLIDSDGEPTHKQGEITDVDSEKNDETDDDMIAKCEVCDSIADRLWIDKKRVCHQCMVKEIYSGYKERDKGKEFVEWLMQY